MRNLINLHIHTTASDGEYSPLETLNKIKQTELKTFSYTDHDTIDGCLEIANVNLDDLEFINGCEFSSKPHFDIPKARLHILGYDMDLSNTDLQNYIINKRKYTLYNIELQLNNLKKVYNIDFPQEEITQFFKKKILNRADIAKLLLKYNYATDVEDAFQKYLISNYEQVRKNFRLFDDKEIINVIKQAHGLVSIAHIVTNKMNDYELDNFFQFLKINEVDAIELYHPLHNLEYKKYLLSKIEKYHFLISGGTDYHGPISKPNYGLETSSINQKKIRRLSLVDKIRSR